MSYPTRRDIARWPLLRLARNQTKPQVRSGHWPEGSDTAYIAKDVRSLAPMWRVLAGRPTLRREFRALRALNGLPGVPRIVTRPDPDCLIETRLPGRSAFDLGEVPLADAVVQNLEALVRAVHARGVTHGDLHRDNILISEDGEVALVDWATSCVWGATRSPRTARGLRGYLQRECERLDWRAVAKFKLRHAPHLLSSEERQRLLEGGTGLYRLVKAVRRVLQRLRGKPTHDVVAQHAATLE